MLDDIGKSNGPRIIVCCGSGGVGKTTLSAAIGVHGATSGRKTALLTIDPARRLADSLGIGEFREEAQQVELGETAAGELHALMLDSKRTFDRIIDRYAPENLRDSILANRYYQHISNNMAGSQEYMAMERLYEIAAMNTYDLIVLDTPPSRRALDFLEAPQRVLNVLGHPFFMKMFKSSKRAGRMGKRLFSAMAAPAFKAASQLMGSRAMEDLFSFFRLWNEALFEGFNQRARQVEKLLIDPETVFISVTTPQAYPLHESVNLYRQLKERRISFAGFIVNRVHISGNSMASAERVLEELALREDFDADLLARLCVSHDRFSALSESDADMVRYLRTIIDPDITVWTIPIIDDEVTNVSGLRNIWHQLSSG